MVKADRDSQGIMKNENYLTPGSTGWKELSLKSAMADMPMWDHHNGNS